MKLPADHPEIAYGNVGVLLVNLGTPDDLSVKSVRRYLKEFLSDSRVVGIPKIVWWPILNGIILNTRPKKSAAAYAKIWRAEENESPLRYYTRELAAKISRDFPSVEVEYAMRYGQPSIATRLELLAEKGCDRLLVVPLYPQYSATTTASVNDEVFDCLKKRVWQPALRIAHPWYRNDQYIAALTNQVETYFASREKRPDRILLSFHGLPKNSLKNGDPYYCHCQVTGRLIAQSLDYPQENVLVTFQSRFGPSKWLEPYTSDTLNRLGSEGVKDLLILTPGFAADCLETLEEIGMEGHDAFLSAGGESCTVLPCLNDSEAGVAMMSAIIDQELKGWC